MSAHINWDSLEARDLRLLSEDFPGEDFSRLAESGGDGGLEQAVYTVAGLGFSKNLQSDRNETAYSIIVYPENSARDEGSWVLDIESRVFKAGESWFGFECLYLKQKLGRGGCSGRIYVVRKAEVGIFGPEAIVIGAEINPLSVEQVELIEVRTRMPFFDEESFVHDTLAMHNFIGEFSGRERKSYDLKKAVSALRLLD